MVFARLALWFLGLVPLLAIGQSLPSPTFGTATATAHVSNTTRTASGSYTIPSATLNAMASKTTITGSIAKVAGYSPNDFKVVPYNGAAGLANGTLGNKGTTFALQTTMSCCSAGDIGEFGAFNAVLNLLGTGSGNTSGQDYSIANLTAYVTGTDGGTVGAPRSAVFGINPSLSFGSGAAYWKQAVGEEIDLQLQSGATVTSEIGLQIVKTVGDVAYGSSENSALVIGNQSGASSWGLGISFGGYLGYWPFSTTSTLVGCTINPTVGGGSCGSALNGVDLSQISFSGTAFKSNNFSVDQNGDVSASSVVVGGTKFTVSGCTNTATVGGSTAGTVTLSQNNCALVVTMAGSASNTGWSCAAHDRTTPTVNIAGESASTTTTATITIPSGAGATDVISFACVGY